MNYRSTIFTLITSTVILPQSYASANNIDLSVNVDDISYFDVGHTDPIITRDEHSNHMVFDGKDTIVMRINNNHLNGYTVYANATHGSMINIDSLHAAPLPYILDCPSFKSQIDHGFIVKGLGPMRLAGGFNTVVYDVSNPPNTTNHATVQCSMALPENVALNDFISGAYNDIIEFSIIAK